MRTTLDIDDDILQAVKELARSQKTTAGRVISELVRKELTSPEQRLDINNLMVRDGFLVLPSRGGMVTKEQVDRLIDEADRDDAALRGTD